MSIGLTFALAMHLVADLALTFRMVSLFVALILSGCSKEDEMKKTTKEDETGAISNSFQKIKSGYVSDATDWFKFLTCWRNTVDQRLAKEKGWSGLSRLPADINVLTDVADIGEVPAMLGSTTLPLSYIHFIRATRQKGWFMEFVGGTDAEGKVSGGLLETKRIGVFSEIDTVTYKTWVDNSPGGQAVPKNYYSYGYHRNSVHRQNSADMRIEQLGKTIKVGELDQGGVILLNPAEISADGEMEAWTLSFRTHVARYRSFAELMQDLAYVDSAPATAEPANQVPNLYARSPCSLLLRTAANAR